MTGADAPALAAFAALILTGGIAPTAKAASGSPTDNSTNFTAGGGG